MEQPDFPQKIKTLQTIHLAICAGMTAAYVFAGNLTLEKLTKFNIDSQSAVYLLIPIAAFALSQMLFKSQLKQADPRAKLEDKLPIYQTASIIRWAILEGAAFVILFVKPELIVFGLLIVFYLIYLRPNADRMQRDFEKLG